jgi:hypothetical protein
MIRINSEFNINLIILYKLIKLNLKINIKVKTFKNNKYKRMLLQTNTKIFHQIIRINLIFQINL